MAKLTQTVITRESVKEDLLTLSGGNKKLLLYLGVASTVLVFPVLAMLVEFLIHDITNQNGALEIFFSFLSVLSIAILPGVFFLMYFLSHADVRKIKKGMFTVKTDKVVYMAEKLKYTGRSTRLVKVFEFRDSGEVEIDGGTYEYTSHGDEFYLVFIDGVKTPSLTYACKIYDYNE